MAIHAFRWTAVALGAALAAAGVARYLHDRPAHYLARAERCLNDGDADAALPWLELPESSPSTRDRALLLHAQAALAGGRRSEAIAILNGVSRDERTAADLAFWKGRTLYASGEYPSAVGWFRVALRRRPGDVETLRWLAQAADDTGDAGTAGEALRMLVRLKADDAPAWRTLALMAKEGQQYDEALRDYETTLRLNPLQPKARFELAEVLVNESRFAEAEQQLARCRGGVAEAERLALLAQCLLARQDTAGLRQALDEGLLNDPDHVGLLSRRAQIDIVEGRPQEALQRLDRALGTEPRNGQCHYQRAAALRQLGRTADAAKAMEQYSEIRDQFAEIRRLTTAASDAPADPEVRYRLGCVFARLEKPDLASFWYRAALACDPAHAGARAALSGSRGPTAAERRRTN